METESKKITANEAIIRMIGCANVGNIDALYKIADEYKETLNSGGTIHWNIKRKLADRPKIAQLTALPHTVKSLVMQNTFADEMVYLPDNVDEFVKELILEWDNKELYQNHNLPLQNKILLQGPTGNGKTTIARHIAKLMQLPYVEINSDSVVSSHLGSTGANIHNIFKEIKEPCVLFWDEVDTIGRKRGNGNESAAAHENERMVNSMLINIERLGNDVIFIGATNRHDILDSAFLRRFDAIIEIKEPHIMDKEIFFERLKEYYRIEIDMPMGEFKSFSSIKNKFIQEARKQIRESLI